ncbi:hypothetical protein Elgi_12310 [Paenibacillus elgii]|nr:hypothetical protein Elgi_12310 [Paenibacillus elgii]
MPEWYMNELKAYRQIWDEEKEHRGTLWRGGENKYIFHRGLGEPLYPGTPPNR